MKLNFLVIFGVKFNTTAKSPFCCCQPGPHKAGSYSVEKSWPLTHRAPPASASTKCWDKSYRASYPSCLLTALATEQDVQATFPNNRQWVKKKVIQPVKDGNPIIC